MIDRLQHPSDELLLRILDGEVEGAADAAGRSHLAACPQCRERIDRLERVMAAVHAHAASLDGGLPHRTQRDALLAALESGRPARSWPYRWLALAAAFLVAAALWVLTSAKPPVHDVVAAAPPPEDFIALPYSDQNLAPEGAVVLQVELPRTALLLAGMPVAGNPVGERVRAEVLVGADGLARGIRFVD